MYILDVNINFLPIVVVVQIVNMSFLIFIMKFWSFIRDFHQKKTVNSFPPVFGHKMEEGLTFFRTDTDDSVYISDIDRRVKEILGRRKEHIRTTFDKVNAFVVSHCRAVCRV